MGLTVPAAQLRVASGELRVTVQKNPRVVQDFMWGGAASGARGRLLTAA